MELRLSYYTYLNLCSRRWTSLGGQWLYPEDWENQRTEHSSQFLDAWVKSEMPTDVKTTQILAHGTPIREILRITSEQGVDLVVMATHGQTGITHALFGSTTEKVVRRSTVPVLTVRQTEE